MHHTYLFADYGLGSLVDWIGLLGRGRGSRLHTLFPPVYPTGELGVLFLVALIGLAKVRQRIGQRKPYRAGADEPFCFQRQVVTPQPVESGLYVSASGPGCQP